MNEMTDLDHMEWMADLREAMMGIEEKTGETPSAWVQIGDAVFHLEAPNDTIHAFHMKGPLERYFPSPLDKPWEHD